MGKNSMTHRERFCRLCDFEKVDRWPRWESILFWGETVAQWKAEGGLPPDADAMVYYGFEARPELNGGLGFTDMRLSGPPVQWRTIEEDAHTRVRENDLGTILRERLDGTSMPQFIKFPVESHEDWLIKIKPRLDPATHCYDTWHPGDLDILGPQSHSSSDPWCLMLNGLYAFWRNFWGEEKLAYAFYDYPETLHDMARTWLKMHCECTPKIFDCARLDYTFFHEDMAFKNGPLIGPHLFREFMMPYYKDLIPHLRNYGQRRFFLDSDGNSREILDLFIELGMTGMFPFEVAAGYDIREVRKRYPRFVIWGGLDKRVLNGTKDDIKREVMSKVPEVWESGGFIPALDHACQPCPQENFEYYLELIRSLLGNG